MQDQVVDLVIRPSGAEPPRYDRSLRTCAAFAARQIGQLLEEITSTLLLLGVEKTRRLKGQAPRSSAGGTLSTFTLSILSANHGRDGPVHPAPPLPGSRVLARPVADVSAA